MTTAAAIDADLNAAIVGTRSSAAIAKAFCVPISKVFAMRAEHRKKRAEERAARRKIRAYSPSTTYAHDRYFSATPLLNDHTDRIEMSRDAASMATWKAMTIRYEDHPRSRPFDESRAIANTVALSRNPEANRTLGGVVSYESREAA